MIYLSANSKKGKTEKEDNLSDVIKRYEREGSLLQIKIEEKDSIEKALNYITAKNSIIKIIETKKEMEIAANQSKHESILYEFKYKKKK